MSFDPLLPVKTRVGEPALILSSTVKMDGYPILAVITQADGSERVDSFTADGRYDGFDMCGPPGTHARDLINDASGQAPHEVPSVHACAIEQLGLAAAQFDNAAKVPGVPLAARYAQQARELRASIRVLQSLGAATPPETPPTP